MLIQQNENLLVYGYNSDASSVVIDLTYRRPSLLTSPVTNRISEKGGYRWYGLIRDTAVLTGISDGMTDLDLG
jgi:hypothetical protein